MQILIPIIIIVVFVLLLRNVSTSNTAAKIPQTCTTVSTTPTAGDSFCSGKTFVAGVCEPEMHCCHIVAKLAPKCGPLTIKQPGTLGPGVMPGPLPVKQPLHCCHVLLGKFPVPIHVLLPVSPQPPPLQIQQPKRTIISGGGARVCGDPCCGGSGGAGIRGVYDF